MSADSTHVAGPLIPSPDGVDDTASGSEGLDENNYERLAVTAVAALAAIDAANAAPRPRDADEERAAVAAETALVAVEAADAIMLARATASAAVQRPPAPEDAGVAAKRPRRPTTMFEEERARERLVVAAPTAAAADPEARSAAEPPPGPPAKAKTKARAAAEPSQADLEIIAKARAKARAKAAAKANSAAEADVGAACGEHGEDDEADMADFEADMADLEAGREAEANVRAAEEAALELVMGLAEEDAGVAAKRPRRGGERLAVAAPAAAAADREARTRALISRLLQMTEEQPETIAAAIAATPKIDARRGLLQMVDLVMTQRELIEKLRRTAPSAAAAAAVPVAAAEDPETRINALEAHYVRVTGLMKEQQQFRTYLGKYQVDLKKRLMEDYLQIYARRSRERPTPLSPN